MILTRIILSAAGAGKVGGGIGYSTGFFNAKSSPLRSYKIHMSIHY